MYLPVGPAGRDAEFAVKVGGHATLFRTSAASQQTMGDVDKQAGVYTPLNAVQQRIQNELKKQLDRKSVV